MKSLGRILSMAEVLHKAGDTKALDRLNAHLYAYLKKHGHYAPDNDGNTPNPWRRNMDYASWENSPYYGSLSEFMEKFPGGIPEWREWREKSEKDRFKKWDIKKRKAHLNTLYKMAEEDSPDSEALEKATQMFNMLITHLKEKGLSEEDIKLILSELLPDRTEMNVKDDISNEAKKLLEKANDLKPITDDELCNLSKKDLKDIKIGLEGRIHELNEAEKDDDTKSGADAVLQTSIKTLEKALDNVKEAHNSLKKANTVKHAANYLEEWRADRIIECYLSQLRPGDKYDVKALKKAILRGFRDKENEETTVPYEPGFSLDSLEKVDTLSGGGIDKPDAQVGGIINAHYEPVGGDDTSKFEDEPHLFSGEMDKYKDIKDFIKKRRTHFGGQDAADAAYDAAQDFVNYWKLLLKGKKRRKKASVLIAHDVELEEATEELKVGDIVKKNKGDGGFKTKFIGKDNPNPHYGIIYSISELMGKPWYKVLVVSKREDLNPEFGNPQDIHEKAFYLESVTPSITGKHLQKVPEDEDYYNKHLTEMRKGQMGL